MARKTPTEKLRTKINNLLRDDNFSEEGGTIFVNENIALFSFDENSIRYGSNRYYPTKKEEIATEDFSVSIPLNNDNLDLLSSNIANPSKRCRQILDLIKSTSGDEYDSIVIGTESNQVENKTLYLTKEFFDFLVQIDREESNNKRARLLNRIGPSIQNELGIEVEEVEENIDYSLLLREIIEKQEFTQQDIKKLCEQLEIGENNQIVIETRINKQVEWLINTIEDILDIENIKVSDAKQIGFEKFKYTKASIAGPENLMEKILTDFGQFTMFGVPALLNINKFVKRENKSNIQFDLVLIDHLGEIEIVELKRPDKHLLDYDNKRNKFYPCKDLSIAISQTERYLSAVYNQNDSEQKINNKTLREYINEQVGDNLYVESIRPRGIIIMGSFKKICKPYESSNFRNNTTKEEYEENSHQAYREIKDSLKNIKIITYSELLEAARTKLNTEKNY